MKKRNKRKRMMYVILGVLLCAIGIVTVFFSIPYSKTKTEFIKTVDNLLQKTVSENGIFSEEDITGLPLPVKNYFRYCGYIGTPKMSNIKIIYQDVDFSFSKGKPITKIDYTQYNFVSKPIRIAYIDSSMYAIPFEGLDSYKDGKGSMKGVLAKLFPLFNQTGENMDKSSLVNCLSECLIIPNVALQDYIVWEEIDDSHAKATISYYGITASGIFTFNQNGEMLAFITDDREATSTDGKSEKVKWSVVVSGYMETNGIKKPTVFQAIWHYDDSDFTYFDGKDITIKFDVNK
jgi:hypothetical protein